MTIPTSDQVIAALLCDGLGELEAAALLADAGPTMVTAALRRLTRLDRGSAGERSVVSQVWLTTIAGLARRIQELLQTRPELAALHEQLRPVLAELLA